MYENKLNVLSVNILQKRSVSAASMVSADQHRGAQSQVVKAWLEMNVWLEYILRKCDFRDSSPAPDFDWFIS